MPILLLVGAAGLGVGALSGFVVSSGVRSASSGIKYAVLGAGAFFIAKHAGLLK